MTARTILAFLSLPCFLVVGCAGEDEKDGSEDTSAVVDDTGEVADADSDGFPASLDCDDENAAVNPDAEEICDGLDNNCDGVVDEDAVDRVDWFADSDGDGFGDAEETESACEAPAGFIADATDCDDSDADVNPTADETCNGTDDNCDGTIDEAGALDGLTFYADAMPSMPSDTSQKI